MIFRSTTVGTVESSRPWQTSVGVASQGAKRTTLRGPFRSQRYIHVTPAF